VAEHRPRSPVPVTSPAPPRDSIPWTNALFEQRWWLESVAPASWGEAVVRRGDEVIARLPYAYRRRLGMTAIAQPPFTQTLGPWLARTEAKYPRQLEMEKKLLGQLIELLPPYQYFRQCFSTTMKNWLPFYWAGFQATVRYTYRIEDLSDLDRVQHGFQEHVRRGIRKARKVLEVNPDLPLDELLRLDDATYMRQGLRAPHTHEIDLRRGDAAGERELLGAGVRSGDVPRQRSDVTCIGGIVAHRPAQAVAARVLGRARPARGGDRPPAPASVGAVGDKPPRSGHAVGSRAGAGTDAHTATSVKAASSTSATARRSLVAKLAR